MDFSKDILPWIIVLGCGGIVVLRFIYSVKKKGLRASAIQFIVEAEKMFGSKKGQEKMEYVVNAIKSVIPMPFSLLVTTDAVKAFCQSVFDEVKEALDYKG